MLREVHPPLLGIRRARPRAGAAWSGRCQRPLFRRGKGAVDERGFPLPPAACVQLRDNRAPDLEPRPVLVPWLQTTSARRWTRILSGQVAPSRARLQHPQNIVGDSPTACPRAAAALRPRHPWEEWFDLGYCASVRQTSRLANVVLPYARARVQVLSASVSRL